MVKVAVIILKMMMIAMLSIAMMVRRDDYIASVYDYNDYTNLALVLNQWFYDNDVIV